MVSCTFCLSQVPTPRMGISRPFSSTVTGVSGNLYIALMKFSRQRSVYSSSHRSCMFLQAAENAAEGGCSINSAVDPMSSLYASCSELCVHGLLQDAKPHSQARLAPPTNAACSSEAPPRGCEQALGSHTTVCPGQVGNCVECFGGMPPSAALQDGGLLGPTYLQHQSSCKRPRASLGRAR